MTKERPRFSAKEKANHKLDLRAELERLEAMIKELKILYEQYFTGLIPLSPDKAHAEVKRKIRELLQAPFKNHAISYRLKSLEGRYNTFNTYWQRILKQREEGTYARDVFKAQLHEKNALADARSETLVGKAERSMHVLFNNYKEALERSTGRKQNLDFAAFQKSLIERAKEFKSKHQDKKVTFKVVVKEGRVSIQARLKEKITDTRAGKA